MSEQKIQNKNVIKNDNKVQSQQNLNDIQGYNNNKNQIHLVKKDNDERNDLLNVDSHRQLYSKNSPTLNVPKVDKLKQLQNKQHSNQKINSENSPTISNLQVPSQIRSKTQSVTSQQNLENMSSQIKNATGLQLFHQNSHQSQNQIQSNQNITQSRYLRQRRHSTIRGHQKNLSYLKNSELDNNGQMRKSTNNSLQKSNTQNMHTSQSKTNKLTLNQKNLQSQIESGILDTIGSPLRKNHHNNNYARRQKRITQVDNNLKKDLQQEKQILEKQKGWQKFKLKIRLYQKYLNMLLEDPTSSRAALYICNIILFTIFLSCVEIILDSIINTDNTNEGYKNLSYYFELCLFIIFGTEYTLRLLSCTAFGGQIKNFLLSPMNIIDFLSILPFMLDIIFQQNSLDQIKVLRVVRFTRVFRIFKVSRYVKGLNLIIETIKASFKAIIIVFIVVIIVIMFTSVVMFYTEVTDGEIIYINNRTTRITTIPDAMWWSILTMTTVGYGDKVPVSIPGRFLACFTAFLGITVIALPVAILGTNFSQAYQNDQEQEQIQDIKQECIEDHCDFQNIDDIDKISLDEQDLIFMKKRLELIQNRNEELQYSLQYSNSLYSDVNQDLEKLYSALSKHFDMQLLNKTKKDNGKSQQVKLQNYEKMQTQQKKKMNIAQLFQQIHTDKINQELKQDIDNQQVQNDQYDLKNGFAQQQNNQQIQIINGQYQQFKTLDEIQENQIDEQQENSVLQQQQIRRLSKFVQNTQNNGLSQITQNIQNNSQDGQENLQSKNQYSNNVITQQQYVDKNQGTIQSIANERVISNKFDKFSKDEIEEEHDNSFGGQISQNLQYMEYIQNSNAFQQTIREPKLSKYNNNDLQYYQQQQDSKRQDKESEKRVYDNYSLYNISNANIKANYYPYGQSNFDCNRNFNEDSDEEMEDDANELSENFDPQILSSQEKYLSSNDNYKIFQNQHQQLQQNTNQQNIMNTLKNQYGNLKLQDILQNIKDSENVGNLTIYEICEYAFKKEQSNSSKIKYVKQQSYNSSIHLDTQRFIQEEVLYKQKKNQ